MYLTYISDYDQNLKMSQFVLVRYQGAKISEDRKKIEPQYFEAYLQLKPEVSNKTYFYGSKPYYAFEFIQS